MQRFEIVVSQILKYFHTSFSFFTDSALITIFQLTKWKSSNLSLVFINRQNNSWEKEFFRKENFKSET